MMKFTKPNVALTGGLFENQLTYLKAFQKALKTSLPSAESFLLTVPAFLARRGWRGLEKVDGFDSDDGRRAARDGSAQGLRRPPSDPARLIAYAQASTEQSNPRSRGLDKRSISGLVDLFIKEERYVEKALAAQRGSIAKAATLVVKKLSSGGRLIYVGAGTSGRLGVVDASEMPPTFNAPRNRCRRSSRVVRRRSSAAKKEPRDARDTGVAELKARGLTKRDVVCGIAASGQTPFVLAALEYARKVGAGAILLTCNPKRSIRVPVDVEIDLPTGPEIVTGSTRMKAGTATKLVLNMLSTIAMVRLGRVRDNLMIKRAGH